MLISCETSPTYVNSNPSIKFPNPPSANKKAGTTVTIPKGPIDMSTPEGKQKVENLLIDLTESDHNNADAYNDLKRFYGDVKRIYNPKNTSTPTQ